MGSQEAAWRGCGYSREITIFASCCVGSWSGTATGVTAAESGRAAVDLADLDGVPDLVVLGLNLPNESAVAVHAALRRHRPDLPAIFMLSMRGTRGPHLELAPGARIVGHPFTRVALAAAVDDLLAEPPPLVANTPGPLRSHDVVPG